MSRGTVSICWRIIKDIFFVLGSGLILLLNFTLLRWMLFFHNRHLAEAIPATELFRSFLIGIQFDLVVTSFLLMPALLLGVLLPCYNRRRLTLWWLAVVGLLVNFLGVLELDFYKEFHTRLNSLVFQYLKEDPKTVISMLYYGFPMVRYLLLCIGLWLVYLFLIRVMDRLTKTESCRFCWKGELPARVVATVVLAAFLVLCSRGTLRSGPPLRWGDAFHSKDLFANHLALNGVFTLVKAATRAKNQKAEKHWMNAMEQQNAVEIVRQMLLTRYDQIIDYDHFPVLRRTAPPIHQGVGKIENVVVIIMESFSGQFVGALGGPKGITPEFDKLAGKGVLFTNFFSNGTHTHQGMFATLASFPNIPGFEYLMQTPEGAQYFSSLSVLLKARGYNDIYLYNGDFSWDNQEGFFKHQGMTNFIGRYDFKNPKVEDPTWGVSDEDMFQRSVKELKTLCGRHQPFFAVLQTLSNHTPYPLPERLPVSPVTGFGGLNEHLTAMKYSDWALGRFFDEIEKDPCFSKTLFVILGDHGFSLSEQVSSIDLLRFHIPLLIIGPGIRESFGPVRLTVGSQVDVVPTVMGLLGDQYVHQCWGRDLFALNSDDKGFAVIKPSGNNNTVAIVQGDRILVRVPDQPSEFGRYKLLPVPGFQELDDETASKNISMELSAYIQAAMRALKGHRTGVPQEFLTGS